MVASRVDFTLKLPLVIKKKSTYFVSSCPILDICSQGVTPKEATNNLIEAIRMFFISCVERGTLDAVLRECGFTPLRQHSKPMPKDHKFITVPIPFKAEGCHEQACHA